MKLAALVNHPAIEGDAMGNVWTLEASGEDVERVRELLRPRDDDSKWARFVVAQEDQSHYTFHRIVPTSE